MKGSLAKQRFLSRLRQTEAALNQHSLTGGGFRMFETTGTTQKMVPLQLCLAIAYRILFAFDGCPPKG
jgi:hypothetical protein